MTNKTSIKREAKSTAQLVLRKFLGNQRRERKYVPQRKQQNCTLFQERETSAAESNSPCNVMSLNLK